MKYWLIAAAAVAAYSVGILVAADTKTGDKDKDKATASEESKLVAKTREKLTQKIEIDWKDTSLKDCMKELEDKLELKFMPPGAGVSLNQAVSYSAKDKPAKDVLHEVFKDRGLGYIIHRKARDGDRYEGWVQVVQGDERGDAAGDKKDTPPAKTATKTPAKPPAKSDTPPTKGESGGVDEEKAAASKLKQAKSFIEDGQVEDAKDFCEQIIKRFPKTKAAAEAKELLEKIKKK